MPNVIVEIGGREFEVACQPGEEHYLKSAAGILNVEASAISAQMGRVPEQRMLLMAGLMLADKSAGVDEQLRYKDEQIAKLEQEVKDLKMRPTPEPERVEVPVIPDDLMENMAELAARAESLAMEAEEKAGA
jgi:cell division protein ZapA